MSTRAPKSETPEERERLLSGYSARDRQLIERVLLVYPALTVAEAIEYLEEAGVYKRVT
jgi:hypothetical protein